MPILSNSSGWAHFYSIVSGLAQFLDSNNWLIGCFFKRNNPVIL